VKIGEIPEDGNQKKKATHPLSAKCYRQSTSEDLRQHSSEDEHLEGEKEAIIKHFKESVEGVQENRRRSHSERRRTTRRWGMLSAKHLERSQTTQL
jgi:YesN/AraC family two-component response regulator